MKNIRVYLIFAAMLLAVFFLRASFLSFFIWWLVLLAIGAVFMPLAAVLFGRFSSKGYIFSKIIGLALSGYILWLLGSVHILPFKVWAAYLVLAACLGANIFISRKYRIYSGIVRDKSLLRRFVFQEALFILALVFWSFIRGLNPDIGAGPNGLEKFMDFGFVNSCLRSDYFPAADMWYAGKPINYYYLGQYFAAYLTRLSLLPSYVTYNLMMASLFAFSFMASYSIGEQLFEIYKQNAPNFAPIKHAGIYCGALTGALVTLSGSMHTPVYTIFARDKNPHGSYWYPDATRYIGFNPPVEADETIHEFPLYSYVVADLHAHVLNMIFVLAVIGLAIAATMNMIIKPEDGQEGQNSYKRYWPGFCAAIFLIGLFPAVNFWDFPIYIVLSGVMYLYANLRVYNYTLKSWLITFVQVAATGIVSYLVALPFQLSFEAISSSIEFVKINSAFYQLCVLYGYQAVFFIMLVIGAIAAYKKYDASSRKKSGSRQAEHPLSAPPDLSKTAERSKFDEFIEKTNPADILAIILFSCAFGLIAIPEVIYVKDIYPTSPRANTMFKLTYQAFIMLTLGIGYTFARMFLYKGKKRVRTVFAMAAATILLCGAFEYPFWAIHGNYGELRLSRYNGLDGVQYMLGYQEQLTNIYPAPDEDTSGYPLVNSLADDLPVIQYINKNIKGQPVIAEANHLSYTTFGRIAANTGLPGLFNWYTHEELWRNAHTDEFQERIDDLETLYTAGDADTARGIIDKYNIRYIVLGKLERAKYKEAINEDLLRSLGRNACQSNDTYLIAVDSY